MSRAWTDVDLVSREVRVRRDTTKTDAGKRRVALDDRAVGALMSWQIAQAAERDAWGKAYTKSGRVFTYEDGRPLKLQYATRLFDKLRIQAGLPEMTLHGLRHQAASHLINSGAELTMVSKYLGHASEAVTSDLYTHLPPNITSKLPFHSPSLPWLSGFGRRASQCLLTGLARCSGGGER